MNDQQVLALPEAADLVGLSVKTLRKRAQQEAKEAQAEAREARAFMQEFRGGSRWVVTPAFLDTLKSPTQQGTPAGTQAGTHEAAQRIADLEAQVKDLQNALTIATLKADSHEQLATERQARLYELQQSVLALTGAVKMLTEAKTDKQRWWQKKKKALPNPS